MRSFCGWQLQKGPRLSGKGCYQALHSGFNTYPDKDQVRLIDSTEHGASRRHVHYAVASEEKPVQGQCGCRSVFGPAPALLEQLSGRGASDPQRQAMVPENGPELLRIQPTGPCQLRDLFFGASLSCSHDCRKLAAEHTALEQLLPVLAAQPWPRHLPQQGTLRKTRSALLCVCVFGAGASE